MLDAQLSVNRIGGMRALAADVVGTLEADRAYNSEDGFGAKFLEPGSLTTTAGDYCFFRWALTEKAGKNGRTDAMHTLTNQRLNCLHVGLPGLVLVGEDLSCEAAYFPDCFLLDRLDRFFSCADTSSGSVGRNWQIWALTSTNSR